MRTILPGLGHIERTSNARATAEMGMTFIPPEQSLREAGEYLVANGLI